VALKEIEVQIPHKVAPDLIPVLAEAAAADCGLTIALRGTLKTYPGCIHWHFKSGAQRGTLELTWWPKTRRLWIKVHAGRTAPWIDKCAAKLKRRLASAS
jgi:hypothetical protein